MFYAIIFLLAALLLVWILASLWYQNFSRTFRILNKIPGPKGPPLIGNTLDFLVSQEQLFQLDRKRNASYFPIFLERSFNTPFVTILSPEDIEVVLSSTKNITKSILYNLLHSWLGTGLLTSDGSKWQIRRKILTPAFHFSILLEFINTFNDETARFVQKIKNLNDPCTNVVPHVTEFTLHSIAETSMGIKLSTASGNANYKNAVYDYGKILTYRVVRPWLFNERLFLLTSMGEKARKALKNLHDFSRNVIEERKKSNAITFTTKKRLAMLDLLLEAKEKGANIDDEGIKEEVDTFMFEGHDTTSVALCYILLTLANNKQAQDDIRQEIIDIIGDDETQPTYNNLQDLSFTERCLKECLRLYPSVPFIGRTTSEDIDLPSGYTIPKGVMVNIHIYDVHRNPNLWSNPEKFDPDRFLPENVNKRHPFSYIPFSAGPRNCIGQRFALLELKTVLCGILREFILEPVDKPEDLVFVTDMILRTTKGIRVKFCPRK